MVAAPIVVFIVMAQNNNSNSFFIVCFKLFPPYDSVLCRKFNKKNKTFVVKGNLTYFVIEKLLFKAL